MQSTCNRTGSSILTLVAMLIVVVLGLGQAPRDRTANSGSAPSVPAILREATELVLEQDDKQHDWTERVLLHIGDLQIQAGDCDGAFRSIRGSSDSIGRNRGLLHLAERLAREGKRERAFEILGLMNFEKWRQDDLESSVDLQWIERLIASGDLGRAGKAIEQLKSKLYRADGLRKLAVAYSKSNDPTRAANLFTLATGAAAGLEDEYERTEALWKMADAQLAVGRADAANATNRCLVETSESIKSPWTKVSALREAAVVAAKANDEQNGPNLFGRAIDAQKAVDTMSKSGALEQIAVAQASVGYVNDALDPASKINDFGRREAALYAIVLARLKANDVDGAVRTAMSIRIYFQYRDDALDKIVDHFTAKKDLKKALATAQKFYNPSRKATAMLKVATAHAKSGDRKSAEDVAARIKLTENDDFLGFFKKKEFDYRLPSSWGVVYEAGPGFTIQSYLASVERAVEVATAAMTLSLALGRHPDQSYAVLFNEIRVEEVIESLARAHAQSGNGSDALAWAKEIGSSGKVKSEIHALIGVAEGTLDRSKNVAPNSNTPGRRPCLRPPAPDGQMARSAPQIIFQRAKRSEKEHAICAHSGLAPCRSFLLLFC